MTHRLVTVPQALDPQSVGALLRSIEETLADASTRVLVLVGSKDTFCRGMAVEQLADSSDARGATTAGAIDDYVRCLMALRFAGRPTLAVVEGQALGGGVGLLCACDVVLAGEQASFGLPEVLFGLAPAMVLPLLMERVGRRTARVWALTGTVRNAEQARAAGLVDEVVASAELSTVTQRWARRLERGNPRQVATIKQLLSRMPALELKDAIRLGQETTLATVGDPEFLTLMARYQQDGILPWEQS